MAYRVASNRYSASDKSIPITACSNKVHELLIAYLNMDGVANLNPLTKVYDYDWIKQERNAKPFDIHDIVMSPGGKGFSLFQDFYLVPKKRPNISAPTVRTNYQEVPGYDGAIDFTEVINGITYNRIEGSWEFMFAHNKAHGDGKTWFDMQDSFLNYVHGKNCAISLLHDRYYIDYQIANALKSNTKPSISHKIYFGRIFLDKWESDEYYTNVTIKYNLDPGDVYTVTSSMEDVSTGLWGGYPGILIPNDPDEPFEPDPDNPYPDVDDDGYKNLYYQGMFLYPYKIANDKPEEQSKGKTVKLVSNGTVIDNISNNASLVYIVSPLALNSNIDDQTLNEDGSFKKYAIDLSGATQYSIYQFDMELDSDWLLQYVLNPGKSQVNMKTNEDYDSYCKLVFAHRTGVTESGTRGGVVYYRDIPMYSLDNHLINDSDDYMAYKITVADGSQIVIDKFNRGTQIVTYLYHWSNPTKPMTFREVRDICTMTASNVRFRIYENGMVYEAYNKLHDITKWITPVSMNTTTKVFLKQSDTGARDKKGNIKYSNDYVVLVLQLDIDYADKNRLYTIPYDSKLWNALKSAYNKKPSDYGLRITFQNPFRYLFLSNRATFKNGDDYMVWGFHGLIPGQTGNDSFFTVFTNQIDYFDESKFYKVRTEVFEDMGKTLNSKKKMLGATDFKNHFWKSSGKLKAGFVGEYGFVLDPVNMVANCRKVSTASTTQTSFAQNTSRFAVVEF